MFRIVVNLGAKQNSAVVVRGEMKERKQLQGRAETTGISLLAAAGKSPAPGE